MGPDTPRGGMLIPVHKEPLRAHGNATSPQSPAGEGRAVATTANRLSISQDREILGGLWRSSLGQGVEENQSWGFLNCARCRNKETLQSDLGRKTPGSELDFHQFLSFVNITKLAKVENISEAQPVHWICQISSDFSK